MFTSEDGSTISKRPRKDRPKIRKIRKKKTFGAQCVETNFANSGPLIRATAVPRRT
jgi:hypothetical protein